MTDSSVFYQKLASFSDFGEVSGERVYQRVPRDWFVIITDIRGSTKAIEAGRYRDVNLVGAATIMSIVNVAQGLEIPFVFGGDGASFVLPPNLIEKARLCLASAIKMARDSFQLELRVGIVAVSEIEAKGGEVSVAKFALSKHVHQAMFRGGGLFMAEKWVKNPEQSARFLLNDRDLAGAANYEGLECRWNPLKSRRGEVLSLLVKARSPDPREQAVCYQEVLALISRTFAPEDRPLDENSLSLAFRPAKFWAETKARLSDKSRLYRIVYFVGLWLKTALGALFMGVLGSEFWHKYRQDLVTQTDSRKFDEMLRVILDATPEQRQTLQTALDAAAAKGQLDYGLHISNEMIMTCLIFQRNRQHIHFVDGNHGGYALAAKNMKESAANRAKT